MSSFRKNCARSGAAHKSWKCRSCPVDSEVPDSSTLALKTADAF